MITTTQCRAARALLKWKQTDLADRCAISLTTIRNFESEARTPYKSTLKILRETFEAHGIEFIDDDYIGVKLKK